MPVLIPVIVLLSLGVGVSIAVAAAYASERDVPVHEPDEPVTPGKTGYKLVDKLLPLLRQAAASSQVPLGLLVGWIAKESGGKLGEVTRMDERGLFQLHPKESESLGLDHKRLSEDATYSINGGLALIAKYMGLVDKLNAAPRGSTFYWMLVKLAHTMGSGATKIIVEGARKAGALGSWRALEDHALENEKKYFSSTKHSPSKWFPLVDKVYKVGMPFGFGSGDVVVGGQVFDDIVDPLDALRII